jgi:hypothetical protein
MMKKNDIVIYSCENTPGKHDASGAFVPEALAYAELHNCANVFPQNYVRVPAAKSRVNFYDCLLKAYEASGPITSIAFFGHGWHSGIQAGLNIRHIPALVAMLEDICHPDVKIILYACSTAENKIKDHEADPKELANICDGGFADRLRDEMWEYDDFEGFEVYGHKTAGHTTRNPYMVRFDRGGTIWAMPPGSPHWHAWVKALKENKNDIRYTFPFLRIDEIHEVLRA